MVTVVPASRSHLGRRGSVIRISCAYRDLDRQDIDLDNHRDTDRSRITGALQPETDGSRTEAVLATVTGGDGAVAGESGRTSPIRRIARARRLYDSESL